MQKKTKEKKEKEKEDAKYTRPNHIKRVKRGLYQESFFP